MLLPQTQNNAAQIADKIIAAANSEGISLVKKLIIADLPFLGWPVISSLLGYLLGWLDGYLSVVEQTGVSFLIISTQIDEEKNTLSAALKALLAAQKSGNKDEITKAVIAYQQAQSALVNYDGPATPIN
jgi:hypothetical protein